MQLASKHIQRTQVWSPCYKRDLIQTRPGSNLIGFCVGSFPCRSRRSYQISISKTYNNIINQRRQRQEKDKF